MFPFRTQFKQYLSIFEEMNFDLRGCLWPLIPQIFKQKPSFGRMREVMLPVIRTHVVFYERIKRSVKIFQPLRSHCSQGILPKTRGPWTQKVGVSCSRFGAVQHQVNAGLGHLKQNVFCQLVEYPYPYLNLIVNPLNVSIQSINCRHEGW